MSSPEDVVYQDSQITEILDFHKTAAAPVLFERYRISGKNQDAFVAALIGRLCLLDTQRMCRAKGVRTSEQWGAS